jgi:hypothetical protein
MENLRVDYIDRLTGQLFELETYHAEIIGDSVCFTHKQDATDKCTIKKSELYVEVYAIKPNG